MSTPGERQSAQGLEAQLQKYKEAAVNLPRLVKKYKSLESQHAELRQQSDSTAAALDKSRRALSEAQHANVKLKDRLSKCQSEKSTLSIALEEVKRQNELLQNSADGGRCRDHEETVSPDIKLLADAMKEISALRLEVSSLRTELSRSKQGTVLTELTTIRSQMNQLLQRWPKEDAFLTNSSRACTPVHESLASPPLQSMSSLLTHLGSGDVHRACTPLTASQPKDSLQQAGAQPSSDLSALSTQALHVHAAPRNTKPLASPAHVPECAPDTKQQPSSPLQRDVQANSAAVSAAASQVAGRSTATVAMPGLHVQTQLDAAADGRSTSVPSAAELNFKQPVSVCAGSPEPRGVPSEGRLQPKKRDRGSICPVSTPTQGTNTVVKKKHKSIADRLPKTRDMEGFMKLQDIPSTAQRRWKPQASGLQQKMMKFGSGTVKSTVVTGSCFSFKRKITDVAVEAHPENADVSVKAAVDVDDSSGTELNPRRIDERKTGLWSAPASQYSQDAKKVVSVSGAKHEYGLERVCAGLQEASPIPDECVAAVGPQLDSVEQNVPELDGMKHNVLQLDSMECAVPSGNDALESGPVVPTKEAVEASCGPEDSGAAVEGSEDEPESFTQILQNVAPQLLPAALMSSPGSTCSACSQKADAQLSHNPEQLCKQIAGTWASSGSHCDLAAVAMELASHWNALESKQRRQEFTAELVVEIVVHVVQAASSVSESTVLSALNALKGQQAGFSQLDSDSGDGTSHVHSKLQELLDPKGNQRFSVLQCAAVLQQAQAHISDSQTIICELVAQELCRGAGSAAWQLEQRCEEGEMPNPGMLWFCQVQLTTLVGLLDINPRGVQSSCSRYMPHVLQMLEQADDLAAAIGTVIGIMCVDLGRGDMLGTAHESFARFWDTTRASSPPPLPVSPCALMLQVAMCATSCAAKLSHGNSITVASGEMVWCVGESVWGWRPAGPRTMHSVCTHLMHALESAGTDAESPTWCLLKEHAQLTAVLAKKPPQANKKPTGTAADDDATCDTDSSSSEDSSDSEGEATDSDCAVKGCGQQEQEIVPRVLRDVCQAVTFSARCCGWKWAAHTLLDDTVWPILEKLQKLGSPLAVDIRKVLGDLVGDILRIVELEANGDALAAEYVATVQEALQFVR